MYWRMLKRDIKDKPGLNIVSFIFMIAAVASMVIGSTLIYAIFGGEKKTYEKCRSSDVYLLFYQSIADREGLLSSFKKDLDNIPIVDKYVNDEVVIQNFDAIDLMLGDDRKIVHYFAGVQVLSVPDDYDIPIDLDNNYFEVPDGCIAVSQVMCNRFGLKVGDKIRLATQMGNIYEFVISTVFKNPASIQIDHLYLSDSDKEIFYSECPVKRERFTCTVTPGLKDYIGQVRDNSTKILLNYEDYHCDGYATKMVFLSNDGLFAIIVTTCMLVVAVAVMIMTMITIDFSLKSAIKREEREIGMMKAIGVWSLSYKTLFIVKYLFFAVIGGVIGLPCGFLLSKLLFNKFVMNIMFPDQVMMTMIGIGASIATILVISIFSFFALRRMNKVSVIDAIHGENRGERFNALPGLSLNSKKHIPVPLFLAVSDILRGFKRYMLLILAYVLGICIVLFIVRLNDTLMSTDYAYTYFQQGRMDFLAVIDNTYYSRLYRGAGSFKGAVEQVNKQFEENGIPARITVNSIGMGKMKHGDTESVCQLDWRDADSSEIRYLEGNPPKLRNEVALGYYISKEKNIKIGDTLTVEYEKYSDDHTTFHTVSEDFIVTALVDRFGNHTPTLFMGDDFEGTLALDGDFFSCKIDAPSDQHEEIIKKMQSLYPNGEIEILRNKDIMPHYLTGYQQMLNLIILIVSIICAVVLSLLTALYENIFIDEETADIALLKSMGFSKNTVRLWHFLRLMLLAVFSLGLTYILMATAGDFLVGILFKSLMKSAAFRFKVLPLNNFVIVPMAVICGLAIVICLITGETGKIQIWKVRNE